MADINQGRLQFSQEHGFAATTFLVEPKTGTTINEKLEIAKQTAGEIGQLKWVNGKSVGRVGTTFECTGVESCLQSSIYATHAGGRVVLVGMGTPNHSLPISDVLAREIDLIPTWRYANTYPRAIEIASAAVTGAPVNGVRLPDIRKLITHRYEGLQSISDAFQTAGKTLDIEGRLVVKTVVNFPQNSVR